MTVKRRILLAVLLAATGFPLSAQEKPGPTYLFRFVPGRDMFYVPFGGNQERLDSLLSALSGNREQLLRGERYICVSSYAATASETETANRIAYLRNHRVKSELITRGGVTEAMFVTARPIPTAYNDSLRNVVVVTFPASVEQVAEIAGPQAAAKVEAYNKEVSSGEQQACEERTEQPVEEQAAREQAAAAEATKQAEPAGRAEEEQPLNSTVETMRNEAAPYHFALRANLLRWATLTPDLGVEWRISRHVGIAVNGSFTSWSWQHINRRYALWEINPEVRWYIGKEKRGYVGAMYKAGEFNYKFSATGKQGDLMGGGIVGGYQLRLNNALLLDLSLGLGYIHADYDTYTVIDNVRVRQGKESRNWWGPTQAGVTLVWTIF